jgi:SAM-dependent methyltransferase
VADEEDGFWRSYYTGVHGQGQEWLDYSNEMVQVQGFGLALEAAGQVVGRSALDVGCGMGRFTQLLHALGAAPVTGLELIAGTVAALRQRTPAISWLVGDAADPLSYEQLSPCDLVFALEVLQYVPFAPTIRLLWQLVRPGGRLIGLIPNRACPIVAKPMARFAGRFLAVDQAEIGTALGTLPALSAWRLRGLRFAADQTVVPYAVSPWTCDALAGAAPNRFQFVAIKQAG